MRNIKTLKDAGLIVLLFRIAGIFTALSASLFPNKRMVSIIDVVNYKYSKI